MIDGLPKKWAEAIATHKPYSSIGDMKQRIYITEKKKHYITDRILNILRDNKTLEGISIIG